MRRHVMAAAIAAAVVLAPGLAGAQEMPKPAPEMAQLAYFEGNWTCSGKIHATPMGPAGTMTGTVSAKRDLGGFFLTLAITGQGAGMPAFNGVGYETWDPAAKQFVMFWFDSMGSWSRSTSAGVKGNVMVYEGDSQMGTMKMKTRDTFTKHADGTFTHAWAAEMGGAWMPMGEQTCKK
jgi:hypothetical protein